MNASVSVSPASHESMILFYPVDLKNPVSQLRWNKPGFGQGSYSCGRG